MDLEEEEIPDLILTVLNIPTSSNINFDMVKSVMTIADNWVDKLIASPTNVNILYILLIMLVAQFIMRIVVHVTPLTLSLLHDMIGLLIYLVVLIHFPF